MVLDAKECVLQIMIIKISKKKLKPGFQNNIVRREHYIWRDGENDSLIGWLGEDTLIGGPGGDKFIMSLILQISKRSFRF